MRKEIQYEKSQNNQIYFDITGGESLILVAFGMLSKEFESIIAYRLSYSIKENIKEYYGSFNVCNDIHNRGDLTPFVLMFVDILEESLHQLEIALLKRHEKLKHYQDCMQYLPYGLNDKYASVYNLLIQASLFSENGISTQELMDMIKSSRTTISGRLKTIADKKLLIKKTVGNIRCYSLNLDVVDELYANTKTQ